MNACGQILLLSATLLTAAARLPVSDTTPPRVASFDISPQTVDTSTNYQLITITARVTDNLSGMFIGEPGLPGASSAFATFRSPIQPGKTLTARLYFDTGNTLDFVCKGRLNIPPYSHTGTWTLVAVELRDFAGNVAHVTAADIAKMGGPYTFTVTGTDDRVAPELLSLEVQPGPFDVSEVRQSIPVKARVREALSRFGYFDEFGRAVPNMIYLNFTSPSGKQNAGARMLLEDSDADEILFTGSVDLPRYSETGVWLFNSFQLVDRSGNYAVVDYASAAAAGFQTQFTVTGTADTNPPVIDRFELSRRRIDTAQSNEVITATIRVTDDLSGLFLMEGPFLFAGGGFADFQSPSGNQHASASFNIISDVSSNGASTQIFIPRYSETGIWRLLGINVRDLAGNTARIDTASARELGFATEFAVGIKPSLNIQQQGQSLLLSWPAWASDFHLETRGSVDAEQWNPVSVGPSVLNETAVFVSPISAAPQFFRLAADH